MAQNRGDILDYSGGWAVFSILVLLLLVSLWGAACSRTTPVHKVLALLLLSVLTVFLWMWETQFLFVYIVYILAFIGAVLMLFLSVVLMLPISTFRQSRNIAMWPLVMTCLSTVGGRSVASRPPGFNDLTASSSLFELPTLDLLFDPSYILFMALIAFLYYWFIQLVVYLKEFVLSDDKTRPTNLSNLRQEVSNNYKLFIHNQVAGHCSINIGNCSIPAWVVTHRAGAYSPGSMFWRLPPRSSPLPFTFVTMNTSWVVAFSTLFKLNSRLLLLWVASVNSFLILVACVYYLTSALAHELFYLPYYSVAFMLNKSWFEYLAQASLFLGFFLIAIPSTYKAQNISFLHNVMTDSVGGLENLKDLLYDQSSPFLLISTLVLLVALIGAAVMTRNKR